MLSLEDVEDIAKKNGVDAIIERLNRFLTMTLQSPNTKF